MSGVNTGAKPLRFGVLGAAHINSNAIISPCRSSPQDAIIAALAARDKARALEHVKEHSLQGCEVFDSYQDLLDNADIDAVYVPSPNGLHYEWTMKALEAGFHVLVEKPFASNAEEARIMVRTAKERHLVLMEAAHWYFHPFRERMQAVMASGVLGEVTRVFGNFYFPGVPNAAPETKVSTAAIRYDAALAGGCMMDCGWYPLSVVRTLMGGEVPIVESATAQLWAHDIRIDEGMKARLRFCEGRVEGEIVTSYVGDGSDGFLTPTAPGSSAAYASEDPAHPLGAVRWDAEVTGTAAQMRCTNFGVPHRGNRLLVVAPDGTELLDEVVETDPPGYSTYDLMVLAFCAQVRQVRAGWALSTEAGAFTGAEPIRQAATIDAIYRKAGMQPRSGPASIQARL